MCQSYHTLITYMKITQSILQSVAFFSRMICNTGEYHTIQFQEWQHPTFPIYLQA